MSDSPQYCGCGYDSWELHGSPEYVICRLVVAQVDPARMIEKERDEASKQASKHPFLFLRRYINLFICKYLGQHKINVLVQKIKLYLIVHSTGTAIRISLLVPLYSI